MKLAYFLTATLEPAWFAQILFPREALYALRGMPAIATVGQPLPAGCNLLDELTRGSLVAMTFTDFIWSAEMHSFYIDEAGRLQPSGGLLPAWYPIGQICRRYETMVSHWGVRPSATIRCGSCWLE